MPIPITMACGPCPRGVDDVPNPDLLPWERGLDVARATEIGYGGCVTIAQEDDTGGTLADLAVDRRLLRKADFR